MIFSQEVLDHVKVLVADGEADGRLGVSRLELGRGTALNELFDHVQVAVLAAVVQRSQAVLLGRRGGAEMRGCSDVSVHH